MVLYEARTFLVAHDFVALRPELLPRLSVAFFNSR